MKSRNLIPVIGLTSLIALGSCNHKLDVPKYIGEINVKGVTYTVKIVKYLHNETELYIYENGVDRSKDEWARVSFAVDRGSNNTVDLIEDGPLVTILQHSDEETVQNVVADLDKLLRDRK